jgi:hypothetical protein
MLRVDVWRMVRPRASVAGIETAVGCHTFCATRITDYLTNGGRIEAGQPMAGHSNTKATGLYDRRNDDVRAPELKGLGFEVAGFRYDGPVRWNPSIGIRCEAVGT